MNEILIEKNPTEQRLKDLGVFQWDVWSKGIKSFPWHYDEQEICYITKGSVRVTPEGKEPVLLGKGDLVTFPAGMSCVWEVLEPISKHYSFE
jgi:uncharacterized cupin superfamily protein